MQTHAPHLVRNFTLTYLGLAAGLSIFAVVPSLAVGGVSTLLITLYWALLLAGIVASYAIVVVHFGDEDSVHEGANLGQSTEAGEG